MSELKLYAFTCGMFQSKKSFFVSTDSDEIVRSPIPAYLIEHPKGRALFDTGLNLRFRREADAQLRADEMGFDIDESAEIAASEIDRGQQFRRPLIKGPADRQKTFDRWQVCPPLD